MNIRLVYIFIVLFAVAILSCKQKHFDESVENMNKGEIALFVDDNYRTIVGELIQSYENVYPEAKIHATYAAEKQVLDAMVSGKARMIITGKTLSAAERAKIEAVNEVEPQISKIATEAIAVITSLQAPDTAFDLDAFIASRKADQYTGADETQRYVFVRDQASFLQQLLGGDAANLSGLFSLPSADTLINYIRQTEDSYGFISFALISDPDDPQTKEILQHIKVLRIAQSDSAGMTRTYELSQASIAANEYPLQRHIYIVKGNMAQPLGTGFVNFMFRSKASRIFLKAGLIPAVMPERQLLIKE
jgi:phosphate transport system substrate-binding protein